MDPDILNIKVILSISSTDAVVFVQIRVLIPNSHHRLFTLQRDGWVRYPTWLRFEWRPPPTTKGVGMDLNQASFGTLDERFCYVCAEV